MNLDKMKPCWAPAILVNPSNSFQPSYFIDEEELALGLSNQNVTVYSVFFKNMRTYDRDVLLLQVIVTFGDPVYDA